MWNADNVMAAAASVSAVVALIDLWWKRKPSKESGMNTPNTDTTAEIQCKAPAISITRRTRSGSTVALVCMVMGLSNLAWLQFGPSASAPLSTGNAASIAVSASLLLACVALLFRG